MYFIYTVIKPSRLPLIPYSLFLTTVAALMILKLNLLTVIIFITCYRMQMQLHKFLSTSVDLISVEVYLLISIFIKVSDKKKKRIKLQSLCKIIKNL